MKADPSVEALARTLGVPIGPTTSRFRAEFAAAERHFGEYGFVFPDGGLAVLTLGCGAKFGAHVGKFLASAGFDWGLLRTIAQLQDEIDDWMLVRVLDTPAGGVEAGLYFRRSLTVDATREVLAAHGAAHDELSALDDAARALGTSRVGILGVRLRPARPPAFAPYLHAYEDGTGALATRLARGCAQRCQTDRYWRPFVERMHGEREKRAEPEAGAAPEVGDAFVSVRGGPHPALKLDYFHTPLSLFEQALAESGGLRPGEPSPTHIGTTWGVAHAEHVGVTFTPDGPSRWSLYLPHPNPPHTPAPEPSP